MSIESHPIFKRSVSSPERFLFSCQNGFRVVVYQDSAVRWSHISDPSYNFMPLEPPISHVDSAVLSGSGTLLLLYNASEIRIVEIPWGYSDFSHQRFQKFRYVAERRGPHIKQALFHPLAYQEHCLVVLMSDSTIALLDINYPQTMQPQEHILNKYDGTLGVDSLICEIESITFSLDGLILYALSISEGGDIYAFYPCLPYSIRLKSDALDLLMHKSLLQYESLEVGTPAATKKNTLKQFKLVSELRKRQEEGQTTLDIPPEWMQVRGQGPFTIAPFPERYYDRTSRQLALLPIGSDNELLLMSLDDGTVAVLYRDLEPTMSWDSAGYTYNNSLVLIESIKLEAGKLLVLPGTKGQFYISGKSKTYLVDTTHWSRALSNCIDNSDLQPIAGLDFKSNVVTFDFQHEINSCALWNKVGQSFRVFMSDESVHAIPVAGETLDKSDCKSIDVQSGISGYKPLFTQPLSEIMALNATFQREAKRPLSKLIDSSKRQKPLHNESSEDQLDILTDLSKEFLEKVSIGQSLGLMMHGRFVEQQNELARQLQHSSVILEKQTNLKQISERQSSECDAKSDRQTKILERFDKLNESLVRISESPKFRDMAINDKEIAWFKEIRNQVFAFNQYVHQQKRLQDQLGYVRHELDQIRQQTDNSDNFNSEWKELLTILENDTKIIRECNHELSQTHSEVGAELSIRN